MSSPLETVRQRSHLFDGFKEMVPKSQRKTFLVKLVEVLKRTYVCLRGAEKEFAVTSFLRKMC